MDRPYDHIHSQWPRIAQLNCAAASMPTCHTRLSINMSSPLTCGYRCSRDVSLTPSSSSSVVAVPSHRCRSSSACSFQPPRDPRSAAPARLVMVWSSRDRASLHVATVLLVVALAAVVPSCVVGQDRETLEGICKGLNRSIRVGVLDKGETGFPMAAWNGMMRTHGDGRRMIGGSAAGAGETALHVVRVMSLCSTCRCVRHDRILVPRQIRLHHRDDTLFVRSATVRGRTGQDGLHLLQSVNNSASVWLMTKARTHS
jgi:hypothetical protein